MKLKWLRFSGILLIMLLAVGLSAEEILLRIEKNQKDVLEWLQSVDKNESICYAQEYLDIFADDEIVMFLEEKGIEFTVLSTREEIGRELENYHNYAETLAELETYAAEHSEVTSLFSLGPSVCNLYYQLGNNNYEDYQHEIWCLKVSDNPEVEEDEPNIFLASAIHAREPISLEVVMSFLDELLNNYATDPELAGFIADNQIWFIPLINPDGHKLVIEELHLMHRKNMRDNNNNGMPDYSTNDGVDLNRNFGYVWGANGTSSNPSSSIYNGPNAWSEVEVQYLRNMIQGRKFWAGITYHSQGEWVLYPLGHLPGACSYDHAIMGNLATAMAATIPKLVGTGTYTPAQAVNFGYTCQGTMGDWSYAEERVFGYTIELANEFIPANPEEVCADNMQAFRVILNRLNDRVLKGHVCDSEGEPLVAEVHVVQIDEQPGMSSVEPYRSGALFGSYWRPLLPGLYDVEFISERYVPESFSEIEIESGAVTELEVVLYSQEWVAEHLGDIDINENIDAFDASVLMRYVVGWNPAPYAPLPWGNWRKVLADVNEDGVLDAYDCSVILQYVVGLIEAF